MKKIVITTFIMPNEIDDLERILMDLNKASKYVSGENYELYLALTISDFLVDWENSKLDKEYFIDRFNKLNNKTQIIYKNIMDNVSIKNLRTMYSKYKIMYLIEKNCTFRM